MFFDVALEIQTSIVGHHIHPIGRNETNVIKGEKGQPGGRGDRGPPGDLGEEGPHGELVSTRLKGTVSRDQGMIFWAQWNERKGSDNLTLVDEKGGTAQTKFCLFLLDILSPRRQPKCSLPMKTVFCNFLFEL